MNLKHEQLNYNQYVVFNAIYAYRGYTTYWHIHIYIYTYLLYFCCDAFCMHSFDNGWRWLLTRKMQAWQCLVVWTCFTTKTHIFFLEPRVILTTWPQNLCSDRVLTNGKDRSGSRDKKARDNFATWSLQCERNNYTEQQNWWPAAFS